MIGYKDLDDELLNSIIDDERKMREIATQFETKILALIELYNRLKKRVNALEENVFCEDNITPKNGVEKLENIVDNRAIKVPISNYDEIYGK